MRSGSQAHLSPADMTSLQASIMTSLPGEQQQTTIGVGRVLNNVRRLVVLGAGGVGKSALVQQYIRGRFTTSYKPTVEDLHLHHVPLSGTSSVLTEILDTAGHHQFPAMRELAIKSGHAFLIVYAINDLPSFTEAMKLINMVHAIKGDLSCPITLVGNKLDIETDTQQVKRSEAATCSSEVGCDFVELSATSHNDVTCAFTKLLGSLHTFRSQSGGSSSGVSTRRRSSLLSRLVAMFGSGSQKIRPESSAPTDADGNKIEAKVVKTTNANATNLENTDNSHVQYMNDCHNGVMGAVPSKSQGRLLKLSDSCFS